MSNGKSFLGLAWEWTTWAMGMGLKLAIIAGVLGFAVYRLRFAPMKVESRAIAIGPIVSEVMGTGTLEPRISATMGPRISGMITKVLADQGDRIVKGQLLVTLYDDDLSGKTQFIRSSAGRPLHLIF